MVGPLDFVLFLRALALARRAQDVRTTPIPEVVAGVRRRSSSPYPQSAQRIDRATRRAMARYRLWFGGIDTCLTRSLVLGWMLKGRGEVSLNIGFRPGEELPAIDGHAWVTVDGHPEGADGVLAQERYTRVLEIPFCRDPGEE